MAVSIAVLDIPTKTFHMEYVILSPPPDECFFYSSPAPQIPTEGYHHSFALDVLFDPHRDLQELDFLVALGIPDSSLHPMVEYVVHICS